MTDGKLEQTTLDSEDKPKGSTNSSQQSDTQQQQSRTRPTPSQQIDAIADLLSGGDHKSTDRQRADDDRSGGDDDDDTGDDLDTGGGGDRTGADTGEAAPLTPKGLAEKLDIEADDVYSMEITIGDDKVTLGDLKDAWADQEATAAETQARVDGLDAREAGLVTDIQALGLLEAMQQLPEKVRNQANAHLTAMAEREYKNFLTLYPDLQKETNRLAFEKDMTDWFKEYGLVEGQFPIRTVGMYRLIKDAIRDRKRAAEARKKTAKKAPKSAKPQQRQAPKGGQQQQQKRGPTGGSIQSQVDQIAGMMTKGRKR